MKLEETQRRDQNLKNVYVMLSESGLVKIGVSQNIASRAASFQFKPVEQKIIKAAYTELLPVTKALMYEAALLGKYRRELIEDGEWCTAKFETVYQTLECFIERKVKIVSLDDVPETSSIAQILLDDLMKAEGYTMKLSSKFQKNLYLKVEETQCILASRSIEARKSKIVCNLPVCEMLVYLSENGITLGKQLL